jgi:aspartate/methionine/tyrosine aminotransferase
MAFFNAILAIADPGDEIILPAPYYFNHEMAIAMLNCRAVIVPTGADYALDVDAIRRAIGPRTKAVVTISPNNPSGAVYSAESLTAVNELCRMQGIYHISDEAYEYFVYDGAEHFSPGSLAGAADHTISLFSLSKAYGFAGWRIGYMTVPERLLTAIKKAQDTILICPPVVSQEAACGALTAGVEYCRRHVVELAQVRQQVLDELTAVSDCCQVARTRGAFYVLVRVDTNRPVLEMVERLIREFGVGVLPGSTFGIEAGCTLRLAYGALAPETVCDGVGRLVRGIRALAH